MSNNIDVIPVINRATMRRFLALPRAIYRTDPAWVEPLTLERKMHFSPKNPYFQHARWQPWIAVKDGRDVGRISAQIDQLHLETHQDDTGFFGMIEAIENEQIFHELLKTAENWLLKSGIKRVRGPFNLSINQESGLLVEGFDTPPTFLMGHARPYYADLIEQNGYRKEKDLLAFEIDSQFAQPRAMRRLIEKSADNIRLRPLNRKQIAADFAQMCDIFNDAWSENWGFIPFTREEFIDIGKSLAPMIKDDFVQIATVDGDPAGMIVMLPDFNQLIRGLHGRLFPTGLLRLLWRLKAHPPSHGRIPLMGIRKQHRDSFVGTALAYQLIGAIQAPAQRAGIQGMELSWILENNHNLIEIIASLGGKQSKIYRVYEKDLKA